MKHDQAALSLQQHEHDSYYVVNKVNGKYTHTQPFKGLWSGTTQVGQYQKKHSPTHTHPDHQISFIPFLHLQRPTASSLFSLQA